jgi:hypothetical protein
MTTITDLTDIAPSRALDAALHIHLVGPVLSLKSGHFIDDGMPVPAYSSSVDAVFALCDALIPGWARMIYSGANSDGVWLQPDFACQVHGPAFLEHYTKAAAHGYDPLIDGPGLELSTAPAGRTALAMIACLLAVLDGLEQDRLPHSDARELRDMILRAEKPATIKRHSRAIAAPERDNTSILAALQSA